MNLDAMWRWPVSASGGADDDLRRFADDLRQLRTAAGISSYRALAGRAHFSHTVLAQAASGQALPSLAVTLGFVAACGGDLAAWESRWRRLRLSIEGAAAEPVTISSPWNWEPVADGSDPENAGCSPEAITVHARKISLAIRKQIIGYVELRYSRRAHAAWGRFRGYAGLDHLATHLHQVDVAVEVVRDQDAMRMCFEAPYAFDHHWCDLVITGAGLFHAAATIYFDGEIAAYGETDKVPLT